jgi:phage recombination protein Bet
VNALATRNHLPALIDMAGKYAIDPSEFEKTLRETVVPKALTNAELAVFLMVARKYSLNPLTRQIFAIPKKGGGIQPVVSVDGWYSMANDQPQYDGIDFEDIFDARDEFSGVTCRVWRKDRTRPTAVTEWLSECRMQTEPWAKWPRRMTRHKAGIQALRIAFGFSDIVDPDEASRYTQEQYSAPRSLSADSRSNSARAIDASTEARARHVEAEALKPVLDDDEIPDSPAPSHPVLSDAQVKQLVGMACDAEVDTATICKTFNVASISDIPATAFDRIMKKLRLSLKKLRSETDADAGDIVETDGPARPEDERHAAFRAGWAAQCNGANRIPPAIMRKHAPAWLKGYDAAQQAVDIGVMPENDEGVVRALEATVARAFLSGPSA